jgi:hypothetical protein
MEVGGPQSQDAAEERKSLAPAENWSLAVEPIVILTELREREVA